MNPTDSNQNPGSFMSASAGGTNGMGPELARLIAQTPNTGGGAPTLQNSTTPGTPMGPNAPQTAAIPQTMIRPGGQTAAIPGGMPPPPPTAGMPGGPTTGNTEEVKLILGALKEYLGHVADVNRQKAGIVK